MQGCAGLKVVRDNLEPKYNHNLIEGDGPLGTSATERSLPYVDGFTGAVEVEVTQKCVLSPAHQVELAQAMACEDLPRSVEVTEWSVERRGGNILRLIPLRWDILSVLVVLIVPWVIL